MEVTVLEKHNKLLRASLFAQEMILLECSDD